MNFAILGYDDDLVALVAATFEHDQHQVVYGVAAIAERSRFGPRANRIQWLEHWEELLHLNDCDGVIVAQGSGELLEEQLRRLVQIEVPILVNQPISSSLLGFELDMIRQDTRSPLMPYGIQFHPALTRLRSMTAGDSAIGTLQQLVLQRSSREDDREQVLRLFQSDVAWIRELLGDITKVSALGADHDNPSYANLNVQMATKSQTVSHWSIRPTTRNPGLTISFIGSADSATFLLPDEQPTWSLDVPGQEQCTFPANAAAKVAVEQFAQAIGRPDNSSQWIACCRDAEVRETVPHSLRRSRAIDLYQEAHTEAGAFKGVMAMAGCGLLLGGLALFMIAVLVAAFQLPIRENFIWRKWPIALLVMMSGFLALQLLKFVVPQPESLHDQTPPAKPNTKNGK